MKRQWECDVWWRIGSVHVFVRAWTREGAMREARKRAKAQKPRADIVGVTVHA